MIEVTCNIGTDDDPKWGVYRYVSDDKSKYWLGIRPLEGTRFTRHTVAPKMHWSTFQKVAIEGGVDPASFRTNKAEKKAASPRQRKAKKNPGISIF